MTIFASMGQAAETEFYRAGPAARENLSLGEDNFTSFRRKKVYEVRPYQLDVDGRIVDPLNRERQIGDFFVVPFYGMKEEADGIMYPAACKGRTQVYCCETDRFETFTWEDMWRESALDNHKNDWEPKLRMQFDSFASDPDTFSDYPDSNTNLSELRKIASGFGCNTNNVVVVSSELIEKGLDELQARFLEYLGTDLAKFSTERVHFDQYVTDFPTVLTSMELLLQRTDLPRVRDTMEDCFKKIELDSGLFFMGHSFTAELMTTLSKVVVFVQGCKSDDELCNAVQVRPSDISAYITLFKCTQAAIVGVELCIAIRGQITMFEMTLKSVVDCYDLLDGKERLRPPSHTANSIGFAVAKAYENRAEDLQPLIRAGWTEAMAKSSMIAKTATLFDRELCDSFGITQDLMDVYRAKCSSSSGHAADLCDKYLQPHNTSTDGPFGFYVDLARAELLQDSTILRKNPGSVSMSKSYENLVALQNALVQVHVGSRCNKLGERNQTVTIDPIMMAYLFDHKTTNYSFVSKNGTDAPLKITRENVSFDISLSSLDSNALGLLRMLFSDAEFEYLDNTLKCRGVVYSVNDVPLVNGRPSAAMLRYEELAKKACSYSNLSDVLISSIYDQLHLRDTYNVSTSVKPSPNRRHPYDLLCLRPFRHYTMGSGILVTP
jgi:hypothetical protein